MTGSRGADAVTHARAGRTGETRGPDGGEAGGGAAPAGTAAGRAVEVTTRGAAGTRAVAAAVAAHLEPGDAVVLSGELGTGKTVFVKGLAAALGVDEPVVSPTFTLVRHYRGRHHLVHVDVYRLRRLQEMIDLDLDDVFGDDRITVVEWGEAVDELLPARRLEVGITAVPVGAGSDPSDDDQRVLTVRTAGDWGTRAPELVGALDRFEAAEGSTC